jgi:hypothetical protein
MAVITFKADPLFNLLVHKQLKLLGLGVSHKTPLK